MVMLLLLAALSSADVDAIVDGIYRIEGGSRAKKPFGILSVPCEGYAECRKICENTAINNHRRWNDSGRRIGFIEFLGARYAPVEGDRTGLNRNWVKNLRGVLHERGVEMGKFEAQSPAGARGKAGSLRHGDNGRGVAI